MENITEMIKILLFKKEPIPSSHVPNLILKNRKTENGIHAMTTLIQETTICLY